jgi:hypothetical protein
MSTVGSLMIKLGISSGPIHFGGLRLRIEGTFRKSDEGKRALFGITAEDRELKIRRK